MGMNIQNKAAEILVECGYAQKYNKWYGGTCDNFTDSDDTIGDYYTVEWSSHAYTDRHVQVDPNGSERVNPFSDTLEGRRQADAIEDYLETSEPILWVNSRKDIQMNYYTQRHQWRLDRIKWCLQELSDG
jgi:hypothetical protein